MCKRLLFVDDEPRVLDGYRRTLRKEYELEIAESGDAALKVLSQGGKEFAAIISDFRMPEMNGVEFLKRVQEVSPNSIRVMLSGEADMKAAISAINEGNIYRFISKPCPTDTLVSILNDCIEQYRLKNAERELLEKTLYRSAKTLIDLLSLVNPSAFSRASRIKRYMHAIVDAMKLEGAWEYDLAAMLSQIGTISLPLEILQKVNSGDHLDKEEKELFRAHPKLAYDLLDEVPRLENVALMVRDQFKHFEEFQIEEDPRVALGSQILRAVTDFDKLVHRGMSEREATDRMEKEATIYNPAVVKQLKALKSVASSVGEVLMVKIDELHTKMTLLQDVVAEGGMLLVPKGHEVTLSTIARLRGFARSVGVKEPIKVTVA